MIKNTTENLKKTVLEMFDYVVSLCEKYNIDYFLTYGSLLGAVREKGIIPWDDDVDIGMTYLNMLKLKEAVKKEPHEKYKFLFPFENDSPFLLAKCYDTSTYLLERGTKFEESVCLDIDVFFPFSKQSVECDKLKKNNIALILRYYCFKVKWFNFHSYPTFKWKVSYLLSYFKNKKALLNKIKKICLEDADSYDFYCFIHDKNSMYKKDEIDNLLTVDFEKRKVKIPSCYEKMLVNLYGKDYMIPLPPEKRSPSNILKFDLNKSFLPNKGKLI